MEDDYGRDDQQSDSGSEKDGGPQLTPMDRLFQHVVSDKLGER
ncbi:hypothetical protein TSAR_014911 [Trichomalopsis sarcophagae]|uniref:Uncharacterized protein n=1 Tax=Trichomalopsis sarcophagae TaxID=543379 RepID=A0A232EGM4_9HYME|nr:hypothetical protein TSAR_014911 [Trichomalopsis sarcophagae]